MTKFHQELEPGSTKTRTFRTLNKKIWIAIAAHFDSVPSYFILSCLETYSVAVWIYTYPLFTYTKTSELFAIYLKQIRLFWNDCDLRRSNALLTEIRERTVCFCYRCKPEVGNLRPMGQMRPAWTFGMACIRIFVTQFRVQNHAKTKLHDKQVLKVGCNKKPPYLISR